MTVPLVSVLLASRNGSRYLEEALAGLAAQTLAPEVIAVDDGSTDATPAMLARFAEAQPNVRVLRTPGVGLAGALALAAGAAGGVFLARHDDDDRSHPERLARQVAFLSAHPEVDVLGTEAIVIDGEGRPVGRYGVPVARPEFRRVARRDPPFVHGSVVMRREAYERAGGYRPPFRSSEDLDLWLRFDRERLANLPDELYEWRRHAASAYAKARDTMLDFAAIARAFAAERRDRGADSLELLAAHPERDELLAVYPRAGRLALELGIAYLRDGRVAIARRYLARALADPRVRARAALGWLASWPVALTPRARRHRGEAAA